MKFSINQSELNNAVTVVLKGVATHSTLPVLSGIYLEAKNDSLILQTTDLDLSIQYTTGALVEEEGRTVLPGKLFSNIVKSLPDAAVHIECEDNQAIITCDTASFSIKTLDADDFPGFPHVDTQQEITVPFAQFSSMAKRVARVTSRENTHPILTGVLMTLEDSHFKMVATDSYRLAVAEVDLPQSSSEDFEAVIAGSFIQAIASMPKTAEDVTFALAENQIVVSYGGIVFINRRLEGNYPNYRQLLPDSYETRIKMPVDSLISAVKRTSVLNQSTELIRFIVNIESQTLQLSTEAKDVGSAQETLHCECEGSDIEIPFDYSFVLDGLNSITTENVYFEFQANEKKPGIFRGDNEEKFLYLIMPLRL